MAFFFTDSDLAGSAETAEAEVWLATEFTVPAGTAAKFRWRFPAVASGVTPLIRLFNAGGTALEIGGTGVTTIGFDTSTNDAWNNATPPSPVALSAGTYRVTVNTTRYIFVAGFFSGGSITRGDVTAVQSRFGSPGSAPASTSNTLYTPDIDFASGSSSPALPDAGSAADVLALAATVGLPESASVADVLAVAGALQLVDAGSAVEVLAVAATVSLADLAAAADLADSGQSVPKALADAAAAVERLRITTVRPFTGITTRPNSGITPRP